jgi:ElaB/YqjD/DUF883 family membrane-anchored ribosome-binding protein
VTVDDETVKSVGTTAAGGVLLAFLIGFGRWFMKITGLPARVNRMETRGALSDGVLMALADLSMAEGVEAKKEARRGLSEARQAYLTGTADPGKRK